LALLPVIGGSAGAEARFTPYVEMLNLRAKLAAKRGVAHETHLFCVIELNQSLTGRIETELKALGITFHEVEGRILSRGSLVPAKVPFASLDAVRSHSNVIAIEAHSRGPSPMFVDEAHLITELGPAWRGRDASGEFLTGKGVVIGNIDSEIDVFHPEFFHADGGLYDWIDSNLDNQFTPGLDKVVLEPGGEAFEVQFIDSTLVVNPMDMQPNMPPPPSDGFQANRDWIYLDLNGNGKRDIGLQKGFTDDTPAFGEPLFIADDINQNGFIDPGEKLLRLKTSKIRAVYRIDQNMIRRRGVDLIKVPRPTERSHGTMTVGVLAGGHWSRPYRGAAPDAEISFVHYQSSGGGGGGGGGEGSSVTAGLIWLENEGIDVMMHEYGAPIGQFGDGSSEHESIMDSMHALGIPQCTATHNFAGYPGHDIVSVPADGASSIKAQVGGPYGESTIHYWTLRWREPLGQVEFTLLLPNGEQVVLGSEPQEIVAGDHMIAHSGMAMSNRGTQMAVVFVGRIDGGNNWVPLQPEIYEIVAQSTDGSEGSVDVWLNDEYGYLIGSSLTQSTKKGTLAHPSTADSAIGSGALSANFEMDAPLHDLTSYSGRGPRIDGDLGINVVAPADGLAADSGTFPDVEAAMTLAGGTSGSLPQVTGVVAMLKQLEPDISSDDVTKRIHDGAREDVFTGAVPNNAWGYGKLSAYGTLFEEPAPWENTAPTIVMETPKVLELEEELVLSADASTDPEHESDTLKVRWDVGYDGDWTQPTAISEPLTLAGLTQEGVQQVVVEVFDPFGAFTRRLVEVSYVEEIVIPEPEPEPMPESSEDVVSSDMSEADTGADAMAPDGGPGSKIQGTKNTPKESSGCGGCSISGGGTLPLEPFVFAFIILCLVRRRHA